MICASGSATLRSRRAVRADGTVFTVIAASPDGYLLLQGYFNTGSCRFEERCANLQCGPRPPSVVQSRHAARDGALQRIDHLDARHRGWRQRLEPRTRGVVNHHAMRHRTQVTSFARDEERAEMLAVSYTHLTLP